LFEKEIDDFRLYFKISFRIVQQINCIKFPNVQNVVVTAFYYKKFPYFYVEWCDKKHLKDEIELDIIQIWQKFTAAVAVQYVVKLLVSMLHNDVKCKILIILVALWYP
jgi:hypothetical protein